jgi:hypothetical protein
MSEELLKRVFLGNLSSNEWETIINCPQCSNQWGSRRYYFEGRTKDDIFSEYTGVTKMIVKNNITKTYKVLSKCWKCLGEFSSKEYPYADSDSTQSMISVEDRQKFEELKQKAPKVVEFTVKADELNDDKMEELIANINKNMKI